MRGITQLQLMTFPRVPIGLRTEVTNQPAGMASSSSTSASSASGETQTSTGPTEVGARAIVQVGYRIVPELTVAARGSYQGRTINHAGPGAGAAITYEW